MLTIFLPPNIVSSAIKKTAKTLTTEEVKEQKVDSQATIEYIKEMADKIYNEETKDMFLSNYEENENKLNMLMNVLFDNARNMKDVVTRKEGVVLEEGVDIPDISKYVLPAIRVSKDFENGLCNTVTGSVPLSICEDFVHASNYYLFNVLSKKIGEDKDISFENLSKLLDDTYYFVAYSFDEENVQIAGIYKAVFQVLDSVEEEFLSVYKAVLSGKKDALFSEETKSQKEYYVLLYNKIIEFIENMKNYNIDENLVIRNLKVLYAIIKSAYRFSYNINTVSPEETIQEFAGGKGKLSDMYAYVTRDYKIYIASIFIENVSDAEQLLEDTLRDSHIQETIEAYWEV